MHLFSPVKCLLKYALITAMLPGCSVKIKENVYIAHLNSNNPYDQNAPVIKEKSRFRQSKPKTIDRIILGSGSERYGFQSFDIQSSGLIAVVFEYPKKSGEYLSASLFAPRQTSNFLASKAIKDCMSLSGRYNSNIIDGTQGFVYIDGPGGMTYAYLDNYFPEAFRVAWNDLAFYIYSQDNSSWLNVKKADGLYLHEYIKYRTETR